MITLLQVVILVAGIGISVSGHWWAIPVTIGLLVGMVALDHARKEPKANPLTHKALSTINEAAELFENGELETADHLMKGALHDLRVDQNYIQLALWLPLAAIIKMALEETESAIQYLDEAEESVAALPERKSDLPDEIIMVFRRIRRNVVSRQEQPRFLYNYFLSTLGGKR